jgi:hypothetical protein
MQAKCPIKTQTPSRLIQTIPSALKSVALLLVILAASPSLAQDVPSQTIPVSPNSTVRSAKLHLQPGSTVSVTAESKDAQFAVDLYVYDSSQVLVGKDDAKTDNYDRRMDS